MNLLEDIYYKKEYVSLFLKEGEKVFEFSYKEDEKTFYTISIKKPIKNVAGIEIPGNYFDLETAYGYGGYLCNSDSKEFIKKAFEAYKEKCNEERIIAEFVRYHPFNTSHEHLNNYFDFYIKDRDVVLMDLSLNKDERWETYSSRTRGKIRKCERELEITKSNDIEGFIEIYNETMKKNNADDFFFFDKEFYNKIKDINEIELYNVSFEDTLLSSSFYMFSNDFAHYFLSGNNYNVKKNHNANYFIFEKIAQIAKEKGIKYLNLGGGRSSDPDDSLLKFKSLFSNMTKPFYLSGCIFNNELYKNLTQLWENENPNNSIKYFLKYRL